MVTRDGIVLVEPVGPEHAKWLKGELDRRFGVPVKYVIYSHSHGDHASGAAVFADTARIIGHEALLGLIALPAASTPLPQNLRAGRQRQRPTSSAAKRKRRSRRRSTSTTPTATARSPAPKPCAGR